MPDVAVLERISEAPDQAVQLQKELPPDALTGIRAASGLVLIAIHVGTAKTKSGLWRTTGQLKEDIYQGTCGLVMLHGPGCFEDGIRDGYPYRFNGFRAEIGQWVIFRPGDGKRIQFNGVDCRWLSDCDVHAVIDDPTLITYR